MIDLILKLKKLGVRIRLIDDQIKLDIPNNLKSQEIIAEAKRNRSELISFLKKNQIKNTNVYSFIPKAEKKEYYNTSSAQKGVYVIQHYNKNSTLYNMLSTYKVDNSFTKKKVKSIFEELVRRHSSLRLSFHLIDNKLVQRIDRKLNFDIQVINAEEDEIKNIINHFSLPFRFEKSPLFRIGIINVLDKYKVILFEIHHIISDGISIANLQKEFSDIADGKVLNKKNIEYSDYCELQYRLLQNGRMDTHKKYWLNEFKGEIPNLNLPTNFPKSQDTQFKGNAYFFKLSRENYGALNGIARSNQATMFMVILSLWNILLAKLSGQEDIIIGIPVSDRKNTELETLQGLYLNYLALRNYPRSDISYFDFLLELRNKVYSAYEHQVYPIDELTKNLNLYRSNNKFPLYSVMLNSYNFLDRKDELSSNDGVVENINVHTDLFITFYEMNDSMELTILYNRTLFKESTIKRYQTYLNEIIECIKKNKYIQIKDIKFPQIKSAQDNNPIIEFNL